MVPNAVCGHPAIRRHAALSIYLIACKWLSPTNIFYIQWSEKILYSEGSGNFTREKYQTVVISYCCSYPHPPPAPTETNERRPK